MKFFAVMIVGFFMSAATFAGTDPFKPCESITEQSSHRRCRIGVVDGLIKHDLGASALNEAEKFSKEKCPSVASPRLDPRLRLLVLLDCQLKAKAEFYDKHTDN